MRYYSAIARTEDDVVMLPPGSPYPTYGTAIHRHVEEMSALSPISGPPKYTHRVLLDMGSVRFDDEETLASILRDDPVLSAIFKLGRREGHRDAKQRF